MNPTILMYNGNYFDFRDPDAAVYDINVIAHALGNCSRFCGHTKDFYSVAQHSVLVSTIVPKQYAMQGLLHDAPEAFIHDMTKPLKNILPDYQDLEKRVERAVFAHFDLPPVLHSSIKVADRILLATERRDLMPPHEGTEWEHLNGIQPMHTPIYPLEPRMARFLFKSRYEQIIKDSDGQ